jgi:hypothetical protein
MPTIRATWVFVASFCLIGCGGVHAPATTTETVIQTKGNKNGVLWAVRSAVALDRALNNGDVAEVDRLAFAIGRLGGDVTIAEQIGIGGSRTPFPEPVPPPQPATTACDGAGCTFNHYLEVNIYPYVIDGSVRVQDAAGTRSIDIDLRAGMGTDALHTTTYVTGALQMTPTTVNGAVTSVTTYPDRIEEPQSVRYQAVTFDSGPDPYAATPLSGFISAEWTSDYATGVYTTLATTVALP